ncbi:MAG: hypothetical protein JW704_02730 [Anaerolineaceae bacterium]|nr:hypothetical protein [Anaerolineaceae bacterium]
MKKSTFILFLCGICVLGLFVLIKSTRLGLGLSDDSLYYLSPSQDYFRGLGFSPSLHYPPLFSLLLLIPVSLGIGVLEAAHWINAILFGVNIALASYLSWQISRCFTVSILVGFCLLLFGFFFELHAWAMSEALFIFLLLIAFPSFKFWMDSRRNRWLIISGLFWGLSIATRYIGVAGWLVGFIVLMFFDKPRKIMNLTLFGVGGMLPVLGMLILTVILSEGISDRIFAFYPADMGLLLSGIREFVEAVVPGRFVAGWETPWLAAVVIFHAVIGVFIFSTHNHKEDHVDSSKLNMYVYFYGYILAYFVVLALSRLFFDPFIPFDARILGPILLVIILLTSVLIRDIWSRLHILIKCALLIMITAIMIVNGYRTYTTMCSYYEQGRGYNSARDHVSETYAYLRNYPDTPIYSNAPAALYFWIERHTYPLPGSSELAGMKQAISQSGGFVVIFDSIPLEL